MISDIINQMERKDFERASNAREIIMNLYRFFVEEALAHNGLVRRDINIIPPISGFEGSGWVDFYSDIFMIYPNVDKVLRSHGETVKNVSPQHAVMSCLADPIYFANHEVTHIKQREALDGTRLDAHATQFAKAMMLTAWAKDLYVSSNTAWTPEHQAHAVAGSRMFELFAKFYPQAVSIIKKKRLHSQPLGSGLIYGSAEVDGKKFDFDGAPAKTVETKVADHCMKMKKMRSFSLRYFPPVRYEYNDDGERKSFKQLSIEKSKWLKKLEQEGNEKDAEIVKALYENIVESSQSL